MRKAASTWVFNKFTSFEKNFDLPIAFNENKQSNFSFGLDTRSTIHCNKGQVKHYTFETFMQRVNLIFSYRTTEVFSPKTERNSHVFIGGWLRDYYSRSFGIHLKHSRKFCYDKSSDTKSKDTNVSFDRWSNRISFYLSVKSIVLTKLTWIWKSSFLWRLGILSKTWKVVENRFWMSFYELPSRFRNT